MHNKLPEIHALFFDIDGTILFNGEIPDENADALLQAKSRGHKLFINTGRSRGNLPQSILSLPVWTGFCCGGAYAEIDGTIVENKTMRFSVFKNILDYCEAHGCGCAVESVEGFHTFCTDRWKTPNMTKKELIDLFPRIQVTKVTFDRVLTDYNGLKGLAFTQFPNYTEAFLKGCGKAAIMQTIIDHLKTDRYHTVAFGDSYNDEDMLKFARISVVMAHAPEELKKHANIATASSSTGVSEATRFLIDENIL